MCTGGIDCQFCETIRTFPKVAAAFPTRAEEIALKRSKRVINTICTAPGCLNPKAKGSTQCWDHKRARNRAYVNAKRGRNVE